MIAQHLVNFVTATFIVVACTMTGCASVPTASTTFESKAMRFTAPPGMAAVYVYRPFNLIGSAVLFAVSLDYKDFGSVATKTYLFGTVKPGPHVIKAGGGIPLSIASISFNAQAGKLYFFKVGPGLNQINIEEVDEKTGRDNMVNLRPSGDNVFEFSDKIQE